MKSQAKQSEQLSRKVFVIANWKSHPATMRDLDRLQKSYRAFKPARHVELVVCPSPVHQLLGFPKHIYSGAQNVMVGRAGTGLWTTEMLVGLGITHCIVGHSELRNEGESDIDIRNKVMSLVESGIIPIICIGESVRDNNGKYINVIKHQLKTVLTGMKKPQAERIIIAYEPVWAIGAGAMRECLPSECYESVHIIREEVAKIIPDIVAKDVVVLYGGSVDSNNVMSYLTEGASSGVLIGRASLDPVQMKSILLQVSSTVR